MCMGQILKNDLLTVVIDNHGAELQSVKNNRTQQEYLWQGDKAFWGRRSPVLFPIVGSVWDGKFRIDGVEYALGQHGFARDSDFEVIADSPEDEAWFALESNDLTMSLYPRRFRLEIGYRLDEARLTVMWRVKNLDEKSMSFQIGAHPAFNYPEFNPDDAVHGYFLFDTRKPLVSQLLKEKGCISGDTAVIELGEDGMLPLTGDTFSINTIMLQDRQVRRVSMLDKERRPYVSLLFNAPVVGMWSPSARAPFVCIEPWWGRCDRMNFDGEFSQRDYVNTLQPGETFEASYMVIFDNI